jgi:mono/diheme cytochrome c family protein
MDEEEKKPGQSGGQKSSRRFRNTLIVLGILAAMVFLVNTLILDGQAEHYDDPAMHFKYGSIGSDNLRRGFPYRIWQVLPEMFWEYLPEGKPHTYEAFGVIRDPKDAVDRPIGFSKRWHLGIGDVVGMNCAFCHVSTVRASTESSRHIILGMPANTVDAEAFFRFIFAVVDDPAFTTDNVLAHMKNKGWLGRWQTFIHRYLLIPSFQREVRNMKHRFGFLERSQTPFGPGRVDTWAFYKVAKLQDSFWLLEKLPEWKSSSIQMDAGALTGLADFPALWKEKVKGGGFHWDGNNRDSQERNITAAMGAGVTPATLDLEAVNRISRWFEADTYQVEPYHAIAQASHTSSPLSEEAVAQGHAVFLAHCNQCHGEHGSRIHGLVGSDEIKTDRARLDAFTERLSDKLNEVHHLSVWTLESYWKTNGYANLLLTGVWLRAPYLHNGSVPTLWHLLQEPSDRPVEFCRGNDLYDWRNVGFEWDSGKDDCRGFFKYDTRLPGNGNGGHTYGTTLSNPEKRALIEYLKTL